MPFLLNIKSYIFALININKATVSGVNLWLDEVNLSTKTRRALFRGKYESPELDLLRESVSVVDRVLDLGGGMGVTGILCAKICGCENVLIYEANPCMAGVITRNFLLNGMRANLRARAIGTSSKTCEFYVNTNFLSSGMVRRGESSKISVETEDVSDVISEWKPSVVVLDIEGFEFEVVKSCRFENVQKIIIELHPQIIGPQKTLEVVEHLLDLGFRDRRQIKNCRLMTRD
jgi:FkbM family methyltransferase